MPSSWRIFNAGKRGTRLKALLKSNAEPHKDCFQSIASSIAQACIKTISLTPRVGRPPEIWGGRYRCHDVTTCSKIIFDAIRYKIYKTLMMVIGLPCAIDVGVLTFDSKIVLACNNFFVSPYFHSLLKINMRCLDPGTHGVEMKNCYCTEPHFICYPSIFGHIWLLHMPRNQAISL